MPEEEKNRLTAISDSAVRKKYTDPITEPKPYYARRAIELDRLRAAGQDVDLEAEALIKEAENYINLKGTGKRTRKDRKLPLGHKYEVGDLVSFKTEDEDDLGKIFVGEITAVNNTVRGLYYNLDCDSATAEDIPHKNIFPADHTYPESPIEQSFVRREVVESEELDEHRELLRQLQIKAKGTRLVEDLEDLDGRRRRRIKRTSKKKSADGRRKKSGKKSGKKKSGKKKSGKKKSDGGRKRSKSRRKSKSKSKSKSRRRKY